MFTRSESIIIQLRVPWQLLLSVHTSLEIVPQIAIALFCYGEFDKFSRYHYAMLIRVYACVLYYGCPADSFITKTTATFQNKTHSGLRHKQGGFNKKPLESHNFIFRTPRAALGLTMQHSKPLFQLKL